jgi:hypothetical protein
MRNKYRIDITQDQEKELHSFLSRANMKIESVVKSDRENKLGYIVSLSKYELLFVRLAATAERISRLHCKEGKTNDPNYESEI